MLDMANPPRKTAVPYSDQAELRIAEGGDMTRRKAERKQLGGDPAMVGCPRNLTGLD